jgi:hypothetical protein
MVLIQGSGGLYWIDPEIIFSFLVALRRLGLADRDQPVR